MAASCPNESRLVRGSQIAAGGHEKCAASHRRIDDPELKDPLGFGIVDERRKRSRSEEYTSELQSRFDLVCRLLLEKKNDRDADTQSPTVNSRHDRPVPGSHHSRGNCKQPQRCPRLAGTALHAEMTGWCYDLKGSGF